MRIVLPLLLLLFTVPTAGAQAPTAESTIPMQAPVQAPVQPLPATAPLPAAAGEQASQQQPAHTDAAAAGDELRQQEPKKRSRILWFLVGAVAVLAVVLAVTL